MTDHSDPPAGSVFAVMALFVVVGFPLVGYLWETLNQVMSADVNPGRVLISIPVLLALAGWVALLARRVRRWST